MSEIPVLDRSSAPLSQLTDLKRQFGAVLIRDFFTIEQLSSLRLIGNFAYGIGEAVRELANEDEVPEFLRVGLRGHGWIPWPNVMDWLSTFRISHCAALASIVEQTRDMAVAAYGGTGVRLLEQVSTLRRHRKGPLTAQVPWHRDSAVVKTSPFGQAMNVWIPCVDVGTQSPSLELVLGSHHVMEQIPEPPEPEIENLTEAWVDRDLAGLTRWVPSCRAGDALIFDHNVVHRTQPLAEALIERMSLELRWSPVAG